MNYTEVSKRCGIACLGASNLSEREREINDYYATPPIATKKLLEVFGNKLSKSITILEPSCGEGHIANILIKNGYNVIAQDLIYRSFGTGNIDYLKDNLNLNNVPVNIITNPPYKYAQEFVERSIEYIDNEFYVCMFLKLTFLEGGKRYKMFKKYPPKYIYIFSNRVNCALMFLFNN